MMTDKNLSDAMATKLTEKLGADPKANLKAWRKVALAMCETLKIDWLRVVPGAASSAKLFCFAVVSELQKHSRLTDQMVTEAFNAALAV